MANHTITLTTTEESVYQKYLALGGLTEADMIARIKDSLTKQVIQTIDDTGHEKFKALSVADKLTFLG